MKTQPQAPVINLNGSDPDVLCKQYRAAAAALRTAIEAVSAIDVHGRDFQTAGPDAYRTARIEHTARIHALQAVLDEVMCVHEQVYEQKLSRQ